MSETLENPLGIRYIWTNFMNLSFCKCSSESSLMAICSTVDSMFASLSSRKEILIISQALVSSSIRLSLLSLASSNYRILCVNSHGCLSPVLVEEALRDVQIIEPEQTFSSAQKNLLDNKNLNGFICNLCKDSETESSAFKYYQKVRDFPGFRPGRLTLKLLIRYLLRCNDWDSISLLSEDFAVFGVFPDKSTCCRLVGVCIKARRFKIAEMLLVSFQFQGEIAVSSFSSAMKAHNKLHMYNNAVAVYTQMRSSGVVPDSGCYYRIMEAYWRIGETDKVLSLFQEFKTQNPKPSPASLRVYHILCDSLGKSGRPFEALEFFREFSEEGHAGDSAIYSSLISSFAGIGEVRMAEELFKEAREKEMVKDPELFQKLILMYVEEGSMEKTLGVIQVMKEIQIKASDCILSAVINGYSKHRGLRETIKVYKGLVSSGCEPGQVTYASIIGAYCRLGLYNNAEKVFSEMLKRGFVKCVVAYSNMVSMYGKVGRTSDARRVVAKMKQNGCKPNVWIYNSLMSMHGKIKDIMQVERLWREMKRRKIAPDKISYTSIINAYSKVRDFDACMRFYKEFREQGGTIDLALAGIMVGVYSKGNRIDLLVELLREIKSEKMDLDVRLYQSAMHALRDAGLQVQVKWFQESFSLDNALRICTTREPVQEKPGN